MTITTRITALALALVMGASPALAAEGTHEKGNHFGMNLRGDLRAFLNDRKDHRDALKEDWKQEKKEIKNAWKAEKNDLLQARRDAKEMKGIRTEADLEARIDARIDALVALDARVADSTRLSATEKAEIRATISAQLALLRDLAGRIDDGEDLADIKADLKSSVKTGFGFFLSMPRAAVTAAADRVLSIVDRMESLADRLEARIDDERDDGTNVSVSEDAHADLVAHLNDAEIAANAALSLAASVTIGSTDKDVIAENREKLEDARDRIEDAYQSLKKAREDVRVILDDLDIELTATLEIR